MGGEIDTETLKMEICDHVGAVLGSDVSLAFVEDVDRFDVRISDAGQRAALQARQEALSVSAYRDLRYTVTSE